MYLMIVKMLIHHSINLAGIFALPLDSPSLTSTLLPGCEKSERGGEGSQYLFYFTAVFPASLSFRSAPWDLFVNHPATDTSLCLRLFTASGNAALGLFWRGQAPSYLTDLPMKSQTRSMGLQCYT